MIRPALLLLVLGSALMLALVRTDGEPGAGGRESAIAFVGAGWP